MKKQALLTLCAALLVIGLSANFVSAQDVTPVPGSGMVTGPMDGEATSLNGAGATFPAPLYTSWFADYANLTGVQINYQAIGSGGGIQGITQQTVDFGASDSPLTDDQVTAAQATCGAPVLHIAMTMGGEAITYNIPELAGTDTLLKFTPDTLAGIFLGDISTWNDPALVADNPELTDIAQPVSVVHRSDGSGTTSIFTHYLSAVSDTWNTNVGAGTSVRWPTGIGQKGNSGVAGAIAGVPYAIGYVELAYAQQNSLPIAFLQNKAGSFLQPNVETVSNAAAGVEIPDDERVFIVNGDGDNTYPISGFTWILVCPNQTDPAKAISLTRMLWWATHDGQSYTADGTLGYAPLPEPAIQADEQQILKIMVNGQQALPTEIATPAAGM